MSDYQMIAYAKELILEVNTIYEDVKLNLDKGFPIVIMPEGRYDGIDAIIVLQNLADDIDWEDLDDCEE